MSSFYKNLLWAVTALIVVSLLFSVILETQTSPNKIALNDLAAKINAGGVSKIEVSGENLAVVFSDGGKAIAQKEAGTSVS